MWRVWVGGLKEFRADSRLWVLFTVLATFTALVYLVDGNTPVAFSPKERFPAYLDKNWLLFVVAFAFTSLLGNSYWSCGSGHLKSVVKRQATSFWYGPTRFCFSKRSPYR